MSYDFAVIGAGVFGSWSAHWLRRSAASVLLIDQHGAGNARSSSGGESRIIRMGYGADEIYTRMSLRSFIQWNELFERTGQHLFLKTGVLWMAGGDDSYLAATEATLKRTGVSFDRLSRDELAKRWPQFCFDGIEWSLFEPDSGILMARRAVMAVAKDAIAHGVEYRFGAVLPLSSAAGRKRLASISMASGESVTAETFIFCCGPWLPKVFPDLLAERMFISRQEVFFFGTAPGETAFRQPQCPTWLEMSAGIYGMPNIGGRGFKVAIDTHGPRFDPETGDRTPTAEGLAMARLYVARRFPALASAPLLEARVCQYENTSNGDFLIDRHPEYENVWMVGGGSGHGFKHGPAVGEYVAGVIAGRRTPEPRFRLAAKASHQNRAVF